MYEDIYDGSRRRRRRLYIIVCFNPIDYYSYKDYNNS